LRPPIQAADCGTGLAHSAPPRPPPPGGATHLAELLSDTSNPSPAHQPLDTTTNTTIPPTTTTTTTTTTGDFGNFDFLSMETTPAPPTTSSSPSKHVTQGFDAFGDLLQPSGNSGTAAPAAALPTKVTSSNKVLTGDLDSSLASLAMNLTINKTQTPKNPQWSGAAKTGTNVMGVMQAPAQQPGAQWNAQPMMGTPMNAQMQAQMGSYRPMMAPMTAMPAGPFANPAQPTNAMSTGIRPMMGAGGASAFGVPPMSTTSGISELDPFGAL